MARFPRKLVGIVILLVFLANIWYLSQSHFPKNFDISSVTSSAPESTETEIQTTVPNFESHQQGNSWNKDSPSKDKSHSNSNTANDLDPVEDNKGESGKSGSSKNGGSKGSSKDSSKGSSKDSSKDSSKGSPKESYSSSSPDSYAGVYASNYDAGMTLIKKVLDKISEVKPNKAPLGKYDRDIKSDTPLEESGELPATSQVLGLYLQVADDDVNMMKKTHKETMDTLPDSLPKDSVSGRGIVMTGGGKYFPMVLTAIGWVRESDPTTPIEVFMQDKSEYEPHICDKLFPSLNVECRVIRDIYGARLSDKLDSKYALKPLAILASKFDDVYFMDADSYPLIDIGRIFDWDVYKDTGLILNADYWPRYISPRFYEIVDIKLGGRARGPDERTILQSDRENAVPGRSTESGQVFIRKTDHIKSMLLATYYNIFGPDYYFKLLMQNGHGEGDKDTYAAAATICGEKYYQTQRRPATLGQHTSSGYKGFSMVQPNPIVDYEKFEHHRDDITEEFFALHANSIKSNPKYLLESHEEPMRGAPPLRQQRFFGGMSNVRHELIKDEDVELKLFRAMGRVTCEWAVEKGYVPRDWEDTDSKRMCRILNKHIKWLKENPEADAPDDAPFWIDLEK